MKKFFRIGIICVLLVLESQKIFGNSNHGHRVKRSEFTKDDVKKVMKVMGNLPGYFQQAATVWKIFEQVHDMFAGTPRFQEQDTNARLDALNAKVDKLAANVQKFKEDLFQNLDNKYDRRSVEDKMNAITLNLEHINKDYYAKFLKFTNSTETEQAKSIYNWANDVQRSGGGLQSHLITISSSLLAGLIDGGNSYNNVLDLLAAPNLVNELMCARQKSAQQSIHFLYEQILMAEIRSYLMFLVSIQVTNAVDNENQIAEEKKDEFNERMGDIYRKVKIAMTGASREFWQCDRSFVEGATYSILPPLFQKYVLHEGETRAPEKGSHPQVFPSDYFGCRQDCPSITQKRCTQEMCTHAKSKRCEGVLRDCEFKHKTMKVCSSENSSYRRYEYISTGNGSLFGVQKDCLGKEVTAENRMLIEFPLFYYCDYCLCTCDSSMNGDVGVFFDLRPVGTSLTRNTVITQMKIVNGKYIHFEIKEGELLPGGRINSSTIKDVPYVSSYIRNNGYNVPSDHASITWEKRTICLDDLESPEKDRVLTGVKFGLDRYDRIELVIRVTKFNITTGELYPMETKWIAHRNLPNAPKRSSLSIKYLDIPRGKNMNHPRSQPSQCIEFHTSGLNQDAGQTVVPFIDIQDVTPVPPVALTGAGLFLRGNDDIAGFITPKLFTLDLESYLPEPKISGK